MSNKSVIADLVSGIKPTVEMFKVGPEVITDLIGKLVIRMGGKPTDIKSVTIADDKKRLVVSVSIEKDSDIFKHVQPSGSLTMLGASATVDAAELSLDAVNELKALGFRYFNTEKGREVSLYRIEKNKKSYEIEFDSEIIMAIATNSDYLDTYLVVDASEEVVRKRDYDSKKFKGKKSTVVFAKVQRSCSNVGYNPKQVSDRHNGNFASDENDEDEDD